VTISQHHTKLGNKHDAATNYVDAANCFKKSDPKGKEQPVVDQGCQMVYFKTKNPN
jgi:hypothetical protein